MATSFDPAAGALEFFSTSSLPAGSEVGESRVRLLAVISTQITMFYGPRSNAELVLHSGFHFAGHQSDFTTIHFGFAHIRQSRSFVHDRRRQAGYLDLPQPAALVKSEHSHVSYVDNVIVAEITQSRRICPQQVAGG